MSGLLASLVLIGVVIGLSAVAGALVAAVVTVVYRRDFEGR
jgi:hypothetical protein